MLQNNTHSRMNNDWRGINFQCLQIATLETKLTTTQKD